MKQKLIIVLCFCCIFSCVRNSEAQAAAAGADIVSRIIDSPLVKEMFDRLTRERTPQEKAKPLIRDLYAALLDAKSQRENLKQSIEGRIQLLKRGGSQDQLAANRDEVFQGLRKLGMALRCVRTDFMPLHVDLDAHDPKLADDLAEYSVAQGSAIGMSNSETVRGIESGTWSINRLGDLEKIDRRLKANDLLITRAIAQLRKQTVKLYPDFGELLPGASTCSASSK